MANSFLEHSWRDYSNEPTRNGVRVTTITPANQAAIVSSIGTLTTAEQVLSLGALQNTRIVLSDSHVNLPLPTDLNSQRERKWLVTYKTSAGNQYKYTIPAAAIDDAGTPLLQPNSDMADLTATAWVNWITAFLAVAQGKDGSGATSVLSAELVGRSL